MKSLPSSVLLSLVLLSYSNGQIDSTLRPKVLRSGDTLIAQTTLFMFNRVQVESLTVRLSEVRVAREEIRTLLYLDSLYRVQLAWKDTLLSVKDVQVALFKANEAELTKELDRRNPWYKSGLFHFVLGGVVTAVLTKLAIDYLNAIRK